VQDKGHYDLWFSEDVPSGMVKEVFIFGAQQMTVTTELTAVNKK
jgi:hypothetical protein